MTRKFPAAALLLLTAISASAHRLDEYLQGTILSIAKNALDAEITLTPGVAVFPILIADIDRDANGAISESERHAYAERVLRDLSLAIDGQPLQPHLISLEFPAIAEMKAGSGEIRINFHADLPRGGANRKLTFENHHQRNIAAYQVNVLVPHDPAIRIMSQNRNYSQSFYELDFAQSGVDSGLPALAFLVNECELLGTIALIVIAWVALWSLRRHELKRVVNE
jgi:hypothetical protein